jgi:hypothetical protein
VVREFSPFAAPLPRDVLAEVFPGFHSMFTSIYFASTGENYFKGDVWVFVFKRTFGLREVSGLAFE